MNCDEAHFGTPCEGPLRLCYVSSRHSPEAVYFICSLRVVIMRSMNMNVAPLSEEESLIFEIMER